MVPRRKPSHLRRNSKGGFAPRIFRCPNSSSSGRTSPGWWPCSSPWPPAGHFQIAGSAVPQCRAATDHHHRHLSRRLGEGAGGLRHQCARGVAERRQGPALLRVDQQLQRHRRDRRHLRAGHRSGPGPGGRAEPPEESRGAHAAGGADPGPAGRADQRRFPADLCAQLQGRRSAQRHHRPRRLRRAQYQQRACGACRASASCNSSLPRRPCGSGSIRRSWWASASPSTT